MVITAGMMPGGNKRNNSTLVDEVEIDGVRYLRFTHRDGRMEYRRLTEDEAKFLDGQAAMKEALKQYHGPVAP